MVAAWLRRPFHVLSLSAWPFLLIHLLIGHKELRFLFPIAPVALASAAWIAAELSERWPIVRRRAIVMTLFLVNVAHYIAVTAAVKPPEMHAIRAVLRHVPAGSRLFVVGFDPWDWDDVKLHFYRPKGVVIERIDDPIAVESRLIEHSAAYVLLPHAWLVEEQAPLSARCMTMWRFYPDIVESFGLRDLLERKRSGLLLRCHQNMRARDKLTPRSTGSSSTTPTTP
ncbi:MAG: hypothetical protein HC923_13730 [Myxococcales bacterium]|nr:hypothetical protein [Myxococcales bacterium]